MDVVLPRRRRGTNLTIDPVLVSAGKAAGLNLSKIAEDAIRSALRLTQQEQWLKENAEAIAAYNRRIDERGMLNEGLRQF
ncbi:MAG TPA: type II toxin-antitoxin system CcdA family antitoxin [Rhodospirillaceae bacterium]|nr:type II toxin-antitoxin system CcdA family antitoxin [Rhodospirillaceae bacterium]